jgi:hypothetical protein
MTIELSIVEVVLGQLAQEFLQQLESLVAAPYIGKAACHIVGTQDGSRV